MLLLRSVVSFEIHQSAGTCDKLIGVERHGDRKYQRKESSDGVEIAPAGLKDLQQLENVSGSFEILFMAKHTLGFHQMDLLIGI